MDLVALCKRILVELPDDPNEQELIRTRLVEHLKVMKNKDGKRSFPEPKCVIQRSLDIMRKCGLIEKKRLSEIDMPNGRWK